MRPTQKVTDNKHHPEVPEFIDVTKDGTTFRYTFTTVIAKE